MVIFTGDLKFDLSATVIYLQLMTSLEDSDAGIQNPEVRQTIEEIHVMLERNISREIEQKSPILLSMLGPIVEQFMKKAPPRISWQELAADFSLLCKQDKQLYSIGISHEWLNQRLDCSRYGFVDFPIHARIGIGHHAGSISVEEWFLLDDAFFLLASAEAAYQEMHFLAGQFTSSQERSRHTGRDELTPLNQTVATYSRLSVVSFVVFIEVFVNSVAHDFIKRNSSILNSDDIELLTGSKKGRYLSIDFKLEKYPLIISGAQSTHVVRDLSQASNPSIALIAKFKHLRDSAMHYAPGKVPIWRKPDEWLQEARKSSQACVEVAMYFWRACYPTRVYPRYLAGLNYDNLRNTGDQRLGKVDAAKAASRKAQENESQAG